MIVFWNKRFSSNLGEKRIFTSAYLSKYIFVLVLCFLSTPRLFPKSLTKAVLYSWCLTVIMAFQLGPTEASYYWVYWVPTQYVDAIKDTVLGKWQYFWKHFHLWPRRLTQSEGHCWERPAASLDFRVLELCSKISISNLRWCGDWSQRWCTFTIFFFLPQDTSLFISVK